MKRKRILAMILAVASCLSLAVSASAANAAVVVKENASKAING